MRYISRLPLYGLLALVFLLSFGAVAFAASAAGASDSSSILDMLKPVYSAFAGGHYAYAAALMVIVMVAGAKRYLAPRWQWLDGNAGGSVLALLASSATALSASLAGGGPVTFALLKSAMLIGVGAAGGYEMLKNLIVDPLLRPLAAKAPAWAQPILNLVLWIFDGSSGNAAALATSEAAGTAAVAAKPGTGTEAVTGKPTEAK